MKAADLEIVKETDMLVSVVFRLNDIRDYLIELEARVRELEQKTATEDK